LMHPRWFRSALPATLVVLAVALSGCASSSRGSPTGTPGAAADADPNNDPYESVNRKIWAVDVALDQYLLRPIAVGYRYVTPGLMQTAVINVLNNLRSPVIFVNDLLQGNTGKAQETF